MKKIFTEEQIVIILEEIRNGKSVKEVARENGITTNTIYNCKRKYGNMTKSEIHKLRSHEEENCKLKRLVAELSLDNIVQKDIIKKYCAAE